MTTSARLCVLASGSSGNCSVLHLRGGDETDQILLIDAGLSPKRTRLALMALGLAHAPLAGIVLTHLDHDHWHSGWLNALTPATPVWCHSRHTDRARNISLHRLNLAPFHDTFSPFPGIDFESLLAGHDDLGSALFRIHSGCGSASLGFATDLGRIHPDITRFLSGVHTLAIESNYCPDLQLSSDRPDFLKNRIMGGFGHLSNRQCLDAVRAIDPVGRVVLLHLSRQCNTPDRAAAAHAGSRYEVVVTHAAKPTAWLNVGGGRRHRAALAAATLFDGL